MGTDGVAPQASRLEYTTNAGRRMLGVLWLLASRIVALFVLLQAYTEFRKRYFLRPAEVAFDHTLDLIALQERLHLNVELEMQRWALDHTWAIELSNAYYRALKPSLYLCAALAIVLAPVPFRRIGVAVVLATLIAWPWYALYPLAPPRFMGPYGYPFVDTLHATVAVSPPVGGANPYAAMPSMHIGWTSLAALWLAAALPWWRIGTLLGALHLTLMSLAVVLTGNHFILDIAGGLVVAGVALLLARWVPDPFPWPWRLRRGADGFS